MKKFDYHQPKTLQEAFDLMEKANGSAYYVAGGTDLIVRIKQKVIDPTALISLRSIHGLNGIRSNGGLTMGSMTLLRDVEREPAIDRQYPALYQAIRWLANPQIRNMATVGGNLSNSAPSADCAPPLMVLEAVLTIEGPGGKREVPIDDFFTGPGENCMDQTEILTMIKVPKPEKSTKMAFLKIGRVSRDIAISNASALLIMDKKVCRKCRIAAGAVAPIPLRLREVEDMVEGEEISPELLEKVKKRVEQLIKPISDVRSSEEYRREVTGVLIRRAVEQALEDNK